MRRAILPVMFVLSILSADTPRVRAAADDRHRYKLTTWNHIGGIPRSEVYTIAQDPEGYLWMGTEGGLVRFDGVRFLGWDAIGSTSLPNGAVRLLCIARDGSLWVSIRQQDGRNIVSHASRGQVHNYDERDGLRVGRPTAIVEDPSGTIWVGGDAGFFRWSGTLSRRAPRTARLPCSPRSATHRAFSSRARTASFKEPARRKNSRGDRRSEQISRTSRPSPWMGRARPFSATRSPEFSSPRSAPVSAHPARDGPWGTIAL